jgi:hypothetical protein
MLYMVIERFREPGGVAVYRRFRQRGRMLPEGLRYIDSWIDLDFTVCYQLMECADPALFDAWTDCWQDLVDFQIIPVRSSKDAAEAIAPRL